MRVTVFGGSTSNNSKFSRWDVLPYEESSPVAVYLAAHPYLAVKEGWFSLPDGGVIKILEVSGFRYAVSTTYTSNAKVPDLRVLACKQILWMHFYKVQLEGSTNTRWVPDSIVSDYLRGNLLVDLLR